MERIKLRFRRDARFAENIVFHSLMRFLAALRTSARHWCAVMVCIAGYQYNTPHPSFGKKKRMGRSSKKFYDVTEP